MFCAPAEGWAWASTPRATPTPSPIPTREKTGQERGRDASIMCREIEAKYGLPSKGKGKEKEKEKRGLFAWASRPGLYVVINVHSPTTQFLLDLQRTQQLQQL